MDVTSGNVLVWSIWTGGLNWLEEFLVDIIQNPKFMSIHNFQH